MRQRVLSAGLREPFVVRVLLTVLAVSFLGLFVLVPLVAVFAQAFEGGPGPYLVAITHPETLAAIRLTLLTAVLSVSANLVFGVLASWAIARYDFAGKSVLSAIIDLPFSISPVISGMIFVLVFGKRGLFGDWLTAHDVKIIFAVPGIVLATTFVTFPFVAKEVLPLMEAQGSSEEEAALTLGANPLQMFFRVTLPKIRWGLLYGVILCNARAMGEFGAVSVVSGHISGRTNTVPLQVEILYNEYNFVGAFAVASLLTLLALVTLGAKRLAERRRRGTT